MNTVIFIHCMRRKPQNTVVHADPASHTANPFSIMRFLPGEFLHSVFTRPDLGGGGIEVGPSMKVSASVRTGRERPKDIESTTSRVILGPNLPLTSQKLKESKLNLGE